MEPKEQTVQSDQELNAVNENEKQEQIEGSEPSKEETEVNPDDAKLLRSE